MGIVKKYLRIIKVYFSGSLMNQMEYKFNFLFGGLFELVWLFMYIIFINIVFLNTGSIEGWSKYQVLLLTFQGGLMDSIFTFAIVPGLGQLPGLINTGTLDFFLLKPVNKTFIISLREYDFTQLKNIAINIVGLIYCLCKLNVTITFKNIMVYIFLSFCGFMIIYCIILILMTLAFWLLRIDVVMSIGSQLITVGNKPLSIYPKLMQKLLIYGFPVLIAFNFPVLYMLDKLSIQYCFLSIGMATIWWTISKIILTRGMKRYVSASS